MIPSDSPREACGLFGVVFKPVPQPAFHAFLNALKLFGMGASWGGFESLAIPFEIVTGYTGSSAYMVGLLRGDVDAVLVNLSAARPYVKSGDIRVLAIFGAESDNPAVADAEDLGVPELGQLSLVRTLGGPPNLPPAVRQTLERALLAALADPGFADWLSATGNDVSPAGAANTETAVHAMSQFYENFKQFLD